MKVESRVCMWVYAPHSIFLLNFVQLNNSNNCRCIITLMAQFPSTNLNCYFSLKRKGLRVTNISKFKAVGPYLIASHIFTLFTFNSRLAYYNI